MATLKDVARRAGVSVSTVSHVINGYTDINENTYKQVMQAIRELDYHPSALARNLQQRRSYTLGVITIGRDAVMQPFFSHIVCGMAAGVQSSGYGISLTVVGPTGPSVKECVKTWREQRLEGLVVMGFSEDDPLVEAVCGMKIPVVFLDTIVTGVGKIAISSDNVQGAYSAVKHLLDLGHERIGFIQGMPGGKIIRERWEGYAKALIERGLEPDENLIEVADFTKRGGYQAANRLLSRSNPTAIFCASDLMAFGAMVCARDRGVRVPEDVAVIGFDDITAAEHVTPALTTVRQQGYTMGYTAVTRLLELRGAKSKIGERELIPTELVVRESCGAASVFPTQA